MKAPFIWFGGKRRVAPEVWEALGDVDNYVEPFAGSLAVLLGRPSWHKGRAVNRQLPHLGTAGQGVAEASTASVPTSATRAKASYLLELADRLSEVRVCCGDWARVCTTGALNYGATCGVFLDPPYLGDVRTADLYAVDDHTIAHDVRQWAIDNGDNPRLRIVLAGYVSEHDDQIPPSWRRLRYSASKAYGSSAGGGQNEANRHNECLWFSPHCLNPAQTSLFGEGA